MLRIVVVGAGPMGRLHARAVARRAEEVGDCELVGVLDRHAARSERVAGEFGGRALARGELQGDGAIVAVPAAAHAAVASRVLEAGMDLLVEKPMTGSAKGAQCLVEAAEQRGRILAVGLSEWWNPVWPRVFEAAGTPERIRVDRFHPRTDRGLDIDVVQDFMLHDLDSVRRRLHAESRAVESLEATGRCVSNDRVDEAEAVLTLTDGTRIELAASRVHAAKRRTIEVSGDRGTVSADLITGRVTGPDGHPIPPAPVVAGLGEPLDLQLADFVRACRERSRPENDGEEGVATLELVDRVRAAIGQGV
ncbi:MAG: Gfo/Idh/MocA family oxidoreductase [bacterium]|nr:Gfo/Idh/MocA family oxidoreductase [bacterium]